MAGNMGKGIYGAIGIAFIAVFLILPILMLAANFSPYPVPVILIARNLFQAILSAAFTLLLAFPLAYCMKFNSPARRLLNALSIIPLVLPQPVMILSLILLFGANGYFTLPFPLYSLEGIILAHSLYNFPIAARIISSKWAELEDLGKVARTFGADRWKSFAYVTLPSLKPAIISAFTIVFAFSFTSFSIPLIFGGVTSTTLEVRIFRSFFRDFDLQYGVFLAILQVLIFIPIALLWRSSMDWKIRAAPSGRSDIATAVSIIYLGMLAMLFLPPVSKIAVGKIYFGPMINSILLAASSAAICVTLWFSLGGKVGKYAFIMLGVSPIVLAVAYFYRPYSVLLIPVAHAFISLAIVSSILLPFASSIRKFGDVASTLGAVKLTRMRQVYLPILFKPVLLAFLLAFSISMGETAFLAAYSQGFETMSLSLLKSFSTYRFSEGYFYSGILILLSIIVALIIEGLDVFQGKPEKGFS